MKNNEGQVALQWGIVAMAIGGIILVLVPLTLILSAQIWAHSDRTSGVVAFHAWFARGSVGIITLLAIVGFGCGLKSVHRTNKYGLPCGLSFGGLVLSSAAILLWVFSAIALLNTTESLLQIYG